jgi:hypothetical protein
VCLACAGAITIRAQVTKPTATPALPSKPQPPSDYKVPLIEEALHLSDFTGMQPRVDLKDKLTHITGFIQQVPNDGQPATEETEVYLAHTKTTLFFVFICHDHLVSQLRGHLARRENVLNDDNVSVLLDPFQDRRKGVLFTLNPAGVQADAAWTENAQPDYSYDQVWDSEGRVTADGWMAMFVIPFRSLRFRSESSDWGVVFMRNLPRNSEQDFWPRVAIGVAGVLSQEGTLRGIEGVTGSHNLQLNPYVLAQNVHTLNNVDPLNPYFSTRNLEGTGGGEAKLVIKDSLVLDATINPDFSDVESDQPQFTVDQRYPVYFPELRPFFLENANYFATPIQLVYTRNIVHPEYGIRMTGKLGRTNLGLFLTDDRQPGETVAPGNPLYGKRATDAVGRISQDVGKDSSVGLIYTDEEFGGGWNRIGGADFTWRFTKTWTALGQGVVSSTQGSENSGNPPTYAAGPAFYLELQRSGHAFNLDSITRDYASGFQSHLGFIQTTNLYNNQTHFSYQWFPESKTLQSVGAEANNVVGWDHQGNPLYHYTTLDPFFLLPRNIIIAPIFGQNSDTVGPQDGYPLSGNVSFTENFGGIVFRGSPLTQLTTNIVAIRSGNVNYHPVPGGVPTLLNQETVQAIITVQPVHRLTADNTYLLDRNHSVANGEPVYETQTFRTKLNYQFTRSLSARIIVEYDTTLPNPFETSLQRTKEIQTQALFTWLPHPGTALYVGWNNELQNIDRSLCNRLPDGSCDPNNTEPPRSTDWLNTGRQIFVKFSYLYRF